MDIMRDQREPGNNYLNIYGSRRTMLLNNFLGGISWGIGSVIGATVVLSIISMLITQTRAIPFIGNIMSIAVQEVQKQGSNSLFPKQ